MSFLRFIASFSVLLSLSVPLAAFAPNSSAAAGNRFRPNEKAFKWADKKLKKMTLDEKIGQLVHIGINAQYLSQESNEFKELRRQVVDNKVGGIVVFVGGVYETVHLVNRMQEAAEIPLLISADFETGVGMRFFETVNFPWNMAIAATGNPDYARRQGAIVARESRALGVQQVFAPVVDVNNNADNPVINVRAYGEDPAMVARFGAAFSEGLQAENVLATAKHFPGHGDTAVDSHRGLPVINFTRERLEAVEFAPFRELINSGVGSVMVSHISMPQLDAQKVEPIKNAVKPAYADSEVITEGTTMPATLSPNIVSGILRRDMNFDGLIVTDAMDMSGLTLYFDQAEGAVRAILAGNDVILKPTNSDAPIRGLKEAVASGRLTEARIDQSVRKLLAYKYKLGLQEKTVTPIDRVDTIVSGAATRKLVEDIAQHAITLVRNDEGLLPLAAGKRVVVLCLTNGEDKNFVGNPLVAALRQSGVRVERVAIDERATAAEVEEAIKKARAADTVVAGLYGRVRSGAKNSIGLPAAGERVLRETLASGAKVVSVSFGNPYFLNNFPELKTYVVAYGDMTALQRAAGQALAGKHDFHGKLPITLGQIPRGTGLKLK